MSLKVNSGRYMMFATRGLSIRCLYIYSMRKLKIYVAIKTIKGDIVKRGKRQTYFTKGKIYVQDDVGQAPEKGWEHLVDDLGTQTEILIKGYFIRLIY